ncbi:MAG TPA: sensor histidine kinase [Gemmatimonadaceae bacterium]
MPETQHEASAATASRASSTRLSPGEILAILAFWAFLAVLTAAGRLLDPRIAAMRPELTSGFVTLAVIEYSLWALLTLPILWMTRRFGGETPRLWRVLVFLLIGLVLAVVVDALLQEISRHIMPLPPGRRFRRPRPMPLFFRFEFLYDFMVYMVVLAAGLARNYFVRYQSRLDETRRLQAEAAELHAQLADARLNALRTQLNPHFLFNTLNAISTLVERDPRGVRRMIARLSDLLRHTLDERDEQEIRLAREMEMLRRYLDIMEVRFQGRLALSIESDPALDDALVPNLVLQPLVENAFQHGLAGMEGTGKLAVRAVRDGDELVLTVQDNGPGVSNDRLREGVGLSNTRARLAQLYGERQRLLLSSAPGGGALVEVRLPYHTRSERLTRGTAEHV